MPVWSFGSLETSVQAEAHATSVLKSLTEFAMAAILTVDLTRSSTTTFSAPWVHPVVLVLITTDSMRAVLREGASSAEVELATWVR